MPISTCLFLQGESKAGLREPSQGLSAIADVHAAFPEAVTGKHVRGLLGTLCAIISFDVHFSSLLQMQLPSRRSVAFATRVFNTVILRCRLVAIVRMCMCLFLISVLCQRLYSLQIFFILHISILFKWIIKGEILPPNSLQC